MGPSLSAFHGGWKWKDVGFGVWVLFLVLLYFACVVFEALRHSLAWVLLVLGRGTRFRTMQ